MAVTLFQGKIYRLFLLSYAFFPAQLGSYGPELELLENGNLCLCEKKFFFHFQCLIHKLILYSVWSFSDAEYLCK